MDLLSMIETSSGKFKVEASAEDLVKFAEALFEKFKLHLASEAEKHPEPLEWVDAREARRQLGISSTTLHMWGKRGYLIPTKVGKKRLYSQAAIDRILCENNIQ